MRFLHLGCGPHRLPEPWENFDREVNIEKRLPFDDNSARFIFAEHVIEHIPFVDGMCFLHECKRVLEPGGVLRFAFPDVTRFRDSSSTDFYLNFMQSKNRRAKNIGDVFRFILLGNGHRACWTKDSGMAALAAVGFIRFRSHDYGESDIGALNQIDGHHNTSPVAEIETTVLEATK